jgi:SAM-dependent methyltransferase
MPPPLHERIEDSEFRRAVELLDAGDAARLRAYLNQQPDLVHRRVSFEGGGYFANPSLLEFAAENPVRRGVLPVGIAEVAKVILDAGAKSDRASMEATLALVCSGRVARECGVRIPLIELLVSYGANPNSAMLPALTHGEFEAASALIRLGASIDLPVAAATGQTAEAQRLLSSAAPEERHRALALASQYGHVEIVRLLLDAGEDRNRYNPPGCHAHTTPVHQAAYSGYEPVVRLFVERGARLDLRDTVYDATPLAWAKHGGQPGIEEYLRARGAILETREMLLCTVRGCALQLVREERRLFCERGHSFDVARSGYINLLQPQERRSKHPGDTMAAVAARRRLHDHGVSEPLLKAISSMLELGREDIVLDAGCGDGFYLGSLQRAAGCAAHGVDISIPAVESAARRYPGCEWIVANADRFVPFADRSFSTVLSITARMNATEFRRVLRDDGLLLVAIPAPDDLIELRGAGRDRAARTIETFAGGFALTDRRRATTSADLDAAAVEDVLHSIYRPMQSEPPRAMRVTFSLDLLLFRATSA